MIVRVTVTAREGYLNRQRAVIAEVREALSKAEDLYKELLDLTEFFTTIEIKVIPLKPKELEIYNTVMSRSNGEENLQYQSRRSIR